MRRLNQRIGEITELPLVVGKLELLRAQANAGGRFSAKPAVHVVADEIRTGAAEIAAAASPERHTCKKQRQGR